MRGGGLFHNLPREGITMLHPHKALFRRLDRMSSFSCCDFICMLEGPLTFLSIPARRRRIPCSPSLKDPFHPQKGVAQDTGDFITNADLHNSPKIPKGPEDHPFLKKLPESES